MFGVVLGLIGIIVLFLVLILAGTGIAIGVAAGGAAAIGVLRGVAAALTVDANWRWIHLWGVRKIEPIHGAGDQGVIRSLTGKPTIPLAPESLERKQYADACDDQASASRFRDRSKAIVEDHRVPFARLSGRKPPHARSGTDKRQEENRYSK